MKIIQRTLFDETKPTGRKDMPETIKKYITIERIVLARDNIKLASETETMWYLSTISFVAVTSRHWSNIYLYLCRKWALKISNEVPDFLEKETEIEIEPYEQEQLKNLREWLYKESIN